MFKFTPMRLKAGTNFAEEKSKANEVYFLLSGCVEAIKSNKFYTNGAMFGETDIIFDRLRSDTYSTRMDCHILRLNREYFDQILDNFDDIREDVETISEQREQVRLDHLCKLEEEK